MGRSDPHDYCVLSNYCLLCGVPRVDAQNWELHCVDPDTENVIAISHILAQRRAAKLYAAMLSNGSGK